MKRLSIRWRVTLWNAAGFAVVLLGFGLTVYAMLRRTHYEQVDRGLRDGIVNLQREVQGSDDPRAKILGWVTKLTNQQGVLVAVIDADGKPVAAAENLRHDFLPSAVPSGELSESVVLDGLGHVRRFTTRIELAGRPYTVVQLKDLEHVDEEMGQVVTSLVIATPVAVGLAAALAYMLARKALAPVEQLRRATDEITAHNLHRRLSPDNPHDEIGLLAQTINAMIGRLERSFGEMQRFTADASHELRTPIAVIRSESEMGLDARTPEDAENRFASILEECSRLTWTTDQLLTLAREDAGIAVPAPQPVNLAMLARDIVDSMRPFAAGKEQILAVTGEEQIVVPGDTGRLRQVLRNLLTNAIKYTGPGGRIEMVLDCRNAEIVVAVRDTGIGIAGEHLPFVFDRFYRVDPGRSERDGGAGLGLSIVKSIITAHGGRVEVESTPGIGSVFYVFFPATSRGENAAPKE